MTEKNAFRSTIIAGNWKMYKTLPEAIHFVETLTPLVKESQALVYLAVPFTAIKEVTKCVKELNSSIVIGAQNMHDASEGAFTGEIAAEMLLDVGAKFVILGHSERRKIFGETDAFINKKVLKALFANLQPIVCIGETGEERESGKTHEVLRYQIENSLSEVKAEDFKTLILAYEPIWAIGTGKVAHPEDAQSVHAFCRSVIGEIWGHEASSSVVIQYGGSVKGENASLLLKEEDVDGLLVGGASLSPATFNAIIQADKTIEKM